MSITETLAPTAERLRKSVGYDAPSVDQKTSRRSYRLHSLVESIWRQNKLSKDCWDAYRRFEHDWTASQYYPSRVCRYGATSGTTPLNQLTDEAMDAAEMSIERRMFAQERLEEAQAAIGGAPLKALMMAVEDKHDLATIGRQLTLYSGKMQAQAAAMVLIHVALDRLHLHYNAG